MNLFQTSRRPVSMRRISWTLVITFGVFIITSILLIVLSFRSTGPVSYLRFILSGVAFISGMAWGILSLLAIPRAILYLLRLRRPEASVKKWLSGLAALFLGCFPLVLGFAGIIMIRMPDLHPPASISPLTADQRLLHDALKADVYTLAGTIGDLACATSE